MTPGERVKTFLQKAFKIRKGEFLKTFLMAMYAFNAVAAFIIGRIMKDTLFLSESRLDWLPYMYIIVALGVSLTTLLYTRQVIRLSLRRIINASNVIFVLILLVFRGLLETSQAYWVVPALYVFIEIMGIMLVIQFWTFANELFNAREAKRLFGVIGGGAVLANLYSFPIRSLKEHIGIYNLSFVCIVSILVCLVIFNFLSNRYRVINQQRGRQRSRQQRLDSTYPESSVTVFKSLQNHIVLVTMVMILAVTFVDYQFKVTAQYKYSGEDLADFFFSIYAYGGLLACITQFFLTSRLLEKVGILWALLVLPFALFGGSILTLGFVGFIGVTMAKGGELVTRYTITDTTTQLLYQPLPPAHRRKAKAISDGIMRPAAQAIAGLIFLLLNYFFVINDMAHIQKLSWGILLLLMVWIGLLVSMRHKYIEALLLASDRRSKRTGMETVEDDRNLAISRTVIQKALASSDETQVLNAIEVIPLSNFSDWDESILPLLKNRHPRVRERAIEYLAQSHNRKYSKYLRNHFNDSEERVRAMAIRMYSRLENSRAVEIITHFLHDSSPQVKAATISGLIEFGGLEGILSSTAELKKMLDNHDPVERENGARVLGYIKIKSFYQPLFRLINDPNLDVQRAAIEAAGLMRSTELVPNLIFKLNDPDTRKTAIVALSQYGELILEQLEDVLLLDHISAGIRRSLPVVLSNIPSVKAYEILEKLLETKDVKLRSAVVRAMQKLFIKRDDEISLDYKRIQSMLHSELEQYYQTLVYIKILRESLIDEQLLDSALKDRAKEILDRAFHLLAMIYPREQIEIVSYNMRSSNQVMRSNAMEIIDNICEKETKRYLLPILDSIDLEDKIENGHQLFKLNSLDAVSLLRSFLHDGYDEWLIACTIQTIGKNRISELVPDMQRFIDHDEALLREIVLYALHRMVPTEQFGHISGHYAGETDPVVNAFLDSLLVQSNA